jgi:hypothetical protein
LGSLRQSRSMEPRVSGCESQGRAIDPRACDADGASANEGAESEKRLIKKCRELNSEIVANAAKVQTALKLSEEDQSTIAALKKEIEKAWKLVDASHEKEARAKETIQQLKLEITNLSRLVEQGAGLSLGQEQTVCLCTGHATRGGLSGARDGRVLVRWMVRAGERAAQAKGGAHQGACCPGASPDPPSLYLHLLFGEPR